MKSKLKNVTDFKLKIMKRSLDTAVNISARINVPPLQVVVIPGPVSR